MRLSIYHKAVLAITAILVPIAIAFSLSFLSTKRELEEQAVNNLSIISEGYEGQILHFLEMSKRRVRDFSSDGFIVTKLKEIKNGNRASSMELGRHLALNKKSLDITIQNIFIVDLSGNIVAATDSSKMGENVAGDMRQDLSLRVTEDYSSGTPMLLVSAPVTEGAKGDLLGHIVNTLSFSELNKVMSGRFMQEIGAQSWNTGRPRTLEAYLVNRDRYMITESMYVKDAVMRQEVNADPIRDCIAAGKEQVSVYNDYRGIEVLGSVMCIPSLKWALVVEIDTDEVMEPLRVITWSALAVLIIVAILIGWLFFLFSRHVVAPLDAASGALAQVATGRYDVRLPEGGNDEIGDLSRGFNAMAGELEARSERLKRSEESLLNAQRIAMLGNWDWDIVNNTLHWSDEIFRIFGLMPQEFGATYAAFLKSVHPDDREYVISSVNSALNEKTPYKIDHRIILPNGTERIVHEQGEVTFTEAGVPIRMSGTVQDVTETRKAEEELKRLSMVIENSVNIILITSLKGEIEYVNSAFERITGWSSEEAVGKNPNILSSGETTKEDYKEMWDTIIAGKTWRGIFKNKKKNGQIYWGNGVIMPIKDNNGKITNFLAVQEDITEKKLSEEMVQYLTHYDDITGLFNRTKFMESLSEWIYHQSGNGAKGLLFLIDIDEFKYINDTFGHGVGDEILRRLGALLKEMLETRCRECISGKDMVLGRMGGDEFALFLPGMEPLEGMIIAEELRKRFGDFRLIEGLGHATLSIGAVCYPDHGTTTKELFSKVDAAVYRAKDMGRNRCHLYSPEDRTLENIKSRLEEKDRIQKAFREDRFIPWFQPILDLSNDQVHHYEILARMKDEDGTILLPRVFIDTAERFGLIGEIDRVITDKAIKYQAELMKSGRDLSLGMNISGKNLGNEELLEFIKSCIERYGADPSHIMFEITETAAVHDLKKAKAFISSLKEIGCSFLLDDFGVGFTSFMYLRELNVDYLKIDGSFIRKLNVDKNDRLFVSAITQVAQGMGIKTVAEFVENTETIAVLKGLGVDYAQGYAIGKPAPEPDWRPGKN